MRGKVQYLINWEGIDPDTGRSYSPTWEPEDSPNAELLAYWEAKKAAKGATTLSAGAEDSTPRKEPRKQKKRQTQPKARPSRKARIIESSPEALTARAPTVPSRAATPRRESSLPVPESSPTPGPIAAPTAPTGALQVQISKSGGFGSDEHEPYSQLAASNASSSQSDTAGSDLDSSQLFAAGSGAAHYHSSGIVEDSETSEGEGSFVDPTQQTTGTTQQSSTLNGTQEDVTEDSGLLEIVQEAASRAHSPARSIPETIHDTAADSQSQRRREASLARTEVQDTLESAVEPSLLVAEHEQNADDKDLEDDGETSLQLALQSVLEEGSQPRGQAKSQEQISSSNTDQTTPQLVQVSPLQDSALPKDQHQAEQDSHNQSPTLDSLEGAAQPAIGASIEESSSPQISQSATADHEVFAVPETAHIYRSGTRETLSTPTSEGGANRTQGFANPRQAVSQDNESASLAEHLEQHETDQFPYHSQHPLHPLHHSQDQAQTALSKPVRVDSELLIVKARGAADSSIPWHTHQQDLPSQVTGSHRPIQGEFCEEEQHCQPQPEDQFLVVSTQAEDDELPSELLEPGPIRSQSPAVVKRTEVQEEIFVQSTYDSHNTQEEVRRQGFVLDSQLPRSTDQSTASREQHAQIVHVNNDLSTQEDPTETIRPTIEQEEIDTRWNSPASRHDSSQETPPPRQEPADHSSSPIAYPPSYSLGTLDSQAPVRPKTPAPTSSLSKMATPLSKTGQKFKDDLDARIAARKAANQRVRKSGLAEAGADATPVASPCPVTSSRRLLRTGASDGTRSPSTVPDRSPAPSAPTSLRTIALTQASLPPTVKPREEMAKALNPDLPFEEVSEAPKPGPPSEAAKEVPPVLPAIVTIKPTVPDVSSSDEMDLSDGDADDDAVSLLNDDLQLAVDEYLIPLFIEGRQSDLYSGYIREKIEVLDTFLKSSDDAQPLEAVEAIISHLKAIETHIDLVFAEAGSAPDDVMNPQTQMEFAAQFGMENSTKFRFLQWLFNSLRDHEKHIVLVVDQEDNDLLFDVIEIFCKANYIHYNMPTRGVEADPANYEGNLLVSIFPSCASPIIRPAHAIVCLDGFQEAGRIRQKNWATNPDLDTVPILHLVIPRTVGHIERYLSSSLDKRIRVHTILASLSQMRGQLGKPIDEDTPRAQEAARVVADWLLAPADERETLPLTSIGSVKDLIEFQTQGSQTSAASPAPERTKRPHEEDELDSAKRMRFPPQPQSVLNSSINEHEITRISDSMPGTATEDTSSLRAQIARLEESYQNERALRESEKSRFAEQEVMWDKQQTVHEDQVKQYRLLLGTHQTTEQQLETMTKNSETLRERLASRTSELQTLQARFDEQISTHLLSDDEKIREITQLRKDLATANAERNRAQKAQESADKTLEYTKDEYRKASDSASQSSQTIAALEKQVAALSHTASGQPAILKKLHLDRQYDNLAMQVTNLTAENGILKKSLVLKKEELARAKSAGERMGVRTRGGSVTPQPGKTGVRSRAASPSGMGGRVASLRNG